MHDHRPSQKSNHLPLSIFINCLICIFEVALGFLSGSMALIADALHNLTDVSSMALSLAGERIIRLPPSENRTYGLRKVEVLIALTNCAILLSVMALIGYEAVKRLLHPVAVASLPMLTVAVVALLGNALATWLLRGDSHQNLNLKSAYLHSLQDALFSLGVILGAGLIYLTGWVWIDPVISIVIALFIVRQVFGIASHSLNILLDAMPRGLDFKEVKQDLLACEGVCAVCDLHIWQIDTHQRMLTAHLRLTGDASQELVLRSVQDVLKINHTITHTTIQCTTSETGNCCDCQHCN
ncbi:hypothetical protein AUK40_01900 [Candidatus Wirthbacteria bacterium CG2_30_54_11]|uniref:Cation transporter n=1 Tax=Candidatus Wirthbacteria bacterium CG2_30_54_11 TaxID=1817892 RepID=A0A1J5ILX5_9BACT|nr:MAG: hypothetical protein AUK40_01900 [Candidatus Wirthbacteria bacterium CG2_30_54_11]